MALLCLTGSFGLIARYVPIEAGMAILIWVGFTIGAQAFQAVPRRHAPAVIAGLIPGIGAFTALISKRILGAVGYGSPEQPYGPELFADLTGKGNLYAEGVFALEQGWLYCSIVLTAAMVAIIDRKFNALMGWLAGGAGLAAIGIIHHYRIIDKDITTALGPAWPWVAGYLLALGMLAFVRFFLVSGEAVSDLEIPSAEDAQEQEREIVSEAPVVEGAK